VNSSPSAAAPTPSPQIWHTCPLPCLPDFFAHAPKKKQKQKTDSKIQTNRRII
jgi:hypothetical protein